MTAQPMAAKPHKDVVLVPKDNPWWYEYVLAAVIFVPFIAIFVASGLLWWYEYVPIAYLLLLFACYASIICFGVTFSLHRYFTHRSFKPTDEASTKLRIFASFFASLALEGRITQWVATHWLHHQLSDQDGDPHSPIVAARVLAREPDSLMGVLRGFWYAHIGWMFDKYRADPKRYANYLLKDPIVVWFSDTFWFWAIFSVLFPIPIGCLIAWFQGDTLLYGAGMGFLWGSLVRIAFVHHFTWCVNSVCHIWGDHPYYTGEHDHSGNVKWLLLFTFGESNHNKHHAAPKSALHGDKPWHDWTYQVILFFAWRGWIDKDSIYVVSEEVLENKRREQEALEGKDI